MSTELLRRAATRLREHAQAATPGPWDNLDDGDRLVHLDDNDGFEHVIDEPISNAANAAYVALMHPPVALALADLLDEIADFNGAGPGRSAGPTLLALARAVLREPSDG